jgi:hypothetical protein
MENKFKNLLDSQESGLEVTSVPAFEGAFKSGTFRSGEWESGGKEND